jgi:hypothetical protein
MTRLVLLITFTSPAKSSSCIAELKISNSTDADKTYETCIDFEEATECIKPRPLKIKALSQVSIKFEYLCGYEKDLGVENYWLVYRELGNNEYQKQQFRKEGISL